jgi:hypothetical protein
MVQSHLAAPFFKIHPPALAPFFCVNDLAFPAACGSTVEAAN